MRALAFLLFLALSGGLHAAHPDGESGSRIPSSIPYKQESTVSSSDVGRVVVVFLFVVAVAAGAAYLLKRYYVAAPGDAGGKRIRIAEVRRLGPKTALFLVEVDGRSLLLGQQGDRLMLLESSTKQVAGHE